MFTHYIGRPNTGYEYVKIHWQKLNVTTPSPLEKVRSTLNKLTFNCVCIKDKIYTAIWPRLYVIYAHVYKTLTRKYVN